MSFDILLFDDHQRAYAWHPSNRPAANGNCEWASTESTGSPALRHLPAGLSLCSLLFLVLFPTAKHSENNLLVSPFEPELKWVDFDKPRNKRFNFNIIAFHPHTEYTPLTPLAPPAPPQLQSSKLQLHICTVSELVCLCVGWRRGRHQHSNPHHVFVQKQLSGSWIFGTRKKNGMELAFKRNAYFCLFAGKTHTDIFWCLAELHDEHINRSGT